MAGFINFSAFRPTRKWPDSLIARLKIVGEVMAQALERKRSETALQAAQSTLVRMTRLTTMRAVTASIAHEVNQPLAAIVANGNAAMRFLAFEKPDLDAARTAVNSIVVQGHRASEVIESIRAMFKTIDQERVPLDINKLVQDVLTLMEVRGHEVSVETELKAEPPEVVGNRVQLQQVILNLVMNALDAMKSVTHRPKVLESDLKLAVRTVYCCQSRTAGQASIPITSTVFSMRSFRPNRRAWELVSLCAARLSTLTAAAFGFPPAAIVDRCLTFCCRPSASVSNSG